MDCKQDVQDQPMVVQDGREEEFVSITQAAKLNSVTRQAIYVAIKHNKLKAHKSSRWGICLKDLEEYRENRYSRQKSMFNGESVFDNSKGFYSINQVARILGVPAQKIYYATRTGAISGIRKGAAWVIHESDIEKYKDKHLSKINRKKEQKNALDSDVF
ncbi:MAG: helix-turn-helix domain-containing protein [Victivallaceae bacterium]